MVKLNTETYNGFRIGFVKRKGIVRGETFRWSNRIVKYGKNKPEVMEQIKVALSQTHI